MTAYTRLAPRAASDPVDPLAPKTTVYRDMAVTEAELPPVGLSIAASEISYDPASSGMMAENVQDALDEADGRVDGAELDITDLQGQTAALDAKTQPATEALAGIVELATQAEVDAGVDTGRVVTPATLAVALGAVAGSLPASETVAGIAEIATQAEVDAGLDDGRIVSPLKLAPLAGRVAGAETSIATLQGDVTALDGRLDAAEANITNLQAADTALDSRLDTAEASIATLTSKTGPATETVAGIAELVTQAEVNAGADDARILTPLKLRNFNGWIAGPLGIGAAPTYLLDVVTSANTIARLHTSGIGSSAAVLRLSTGNATAFGVTASAGQYYVWDYTLGKNRLMIDANGVLHLKSGSTIIYDLAV